MVAWLILAGLHPNPKAEQSQAEAQRSIAHAVGNITAIEHQRFKSPKQTEPCRPGEDQRYSDLCAQWKAADAAADSARWAWISAILSGASLAAVAIALLLTVQSNRIARGTAKRQLRAYLSVEQAGLTKNVMANGDRLVHLIIVNSGSTPAACVSIFMERHVGPVGHVFSGITSEQRAVASKTVLGPACKAVQEINVGPINAETLRLIRRGECEITISGETTYVDTFGGKRCTRFAYELDVDDDGFRLVPRADGNEIVDDDL